MKTLLKLEELAMFGLGIYLFGLVAYEWWWFLVLLLTPDFGMLGYLFGDKVGAILYNLFHRKGVAIAIYLLGMYLSIPIVQLIAVILFAHSAFDRMLGYGLSITRGLNSHIWAK